MKILLIRFSSIGDILLTTPLIRALKQQLGAEIHYTCKEQFVPLVADNPHIDKIWPFSKQQPFLDYLTELREEKFDIVFDLHKSLRSIRLRKGLGVTTYSFQKLTLQKWVYVNTKWDVLPNLHIVDRYFKAAEPLGVKPDGGGLEIYISPAQKFLPSDWGIVSPYVTYVVGAAHETKQIPLEQAIPLLSNVQGTIVLVGGPAEREKAEIIVEETCGTLINLCGKLSLQQSADCVRQSGMVLSGDTGMMHIAAAYKRPLVVFWGSTTDRFGVAPYYGEEYVPYINVSAPHLSCRPCSKFGRGKCPKGHFKCMRFWNPIEIATKINYFKSEECVG